MDGILHILNYTGTALAQMQERISHLEKENAQLFQELQQFRMQEEVKTDP